MRPWCFCSAEDNPNPSQQVVDSGAAAQQHQGKQQQKPKGNKQPKQGGKQPKGGKGGAESTSSDEDIRKLRIQKAEVGRHRRIPQILHQTAQ